MKMIAAQRTAKKIRTRFSAVRQPLSQISCIMCPEARNRGQAEMLAGHLGRADGCGHPGCARGADRLP
jgi:hypothetical protein